MGEVARNFANLGNLAFYDGWSPNYFYFNSLTHYINIGNNPAAEEQQKIMAEIAADAKAHALQYKAYMGNKDGEQALSDFSNRFKTIIAFLKKAQMVELNNELDFFEMQADKIESLFTKQELAKIKPLKELKTIFINAQKHPENLGNDFYTNLLININLMTQGLDNTTEILKYEQKRLTEAQNILLNTIQARGEQVKKLNETLKKSEEETRASKRRAEKKIERKMRNVYAQTGTMVAKTKKGNQRYLVTNGRKFQALESTVDNRIAEWVQNVLNYIQQVPSLYKKIGESISKLKLPMDGNYSNLIPEVKNIIVLGLTKYASENIKDILKPNLSTGDIAAAVDEITKSNIFNTVYNYKITGVPNMSGKKGRSLKLFNDVNSVLDLYTQSSEALYDHLEDIVHKKKKTKDDSLLLEVYNSGPRSLATFQEQMKMINELKKLQKKQDKITKQLSNNIKKYYKSTEKDLDENSVDFQSNTIDVKIEIKNGKASVNMDELYEALEDLPEFRKLHFTTFNPASVKTAISTIKHRMSEQIKENLILGMQAYLKESNITESELLSIIQRAAENLEISIWGPRIAESLTAMQQAALKGTTTTSFSGPLNLKNDVVTVVIKNNATVDSINKKIRNRANKNNDTSTIKALNRFEEEIERLQGEWAKEYQKLLEEWQSKINKESSKYSMVGDKFILNMDELRNPKSELFNSKLGQIYRQLLQEVQRWINDVAEEYMVDEKYIREAKKHFFNLLNNSLYVSSNVKTYNTLISEFGFKGGSIGGNLNSQLDRIYDIFQQAGLDIPKAEKEWLESAILNCSPLSIAGEENKNAIQQYLGSTMAFALFDEGGVEGAMIENLYNDVQKSRTKSAPNILHLYKVNTVFVPGSFILARTIQALEQLVPNITKQYELTQSGTTIEIINNGSYNDIVNRPFAEHISNPNPRAWAETGNAIKGKIQLKVMFLAGFLDIINDLNNAMSNIQIPQ